MTLIVPSVATNGTMPAARDQEAVERADGSAEGERREDGASACRRAAGRWSSAAAIAIVAPTEMSMPPAISTSVWPNTSGASSEICRATFSRFPERQEILARRRMRR